MTCDCVHRYLKWFHILGLTTFTPLGDHVMAFKSGKRFERVRVNLQKYMSTTVLFLFIILVSVVLCIYSNLLGKYTHSNGLSKIVITLMAVSLAFTVLIASIAVGQAYFHSALSEQLYTQIEAIEVLLRKKTIWDLKEFDRSMARHICCLAVVYLLPYIAIVSTKNPSKSNLIIMSCDAALTALIQISYFHAFFYIHLLNHMLQSFVKHVELRATTSRSTYVTTVDTRSADLSAMKLEMYYFKLLHFNLWEFTQTINQLFGWILFVYLLGQFMYAVFIFFQMCIILLNPANYKDVMRKFGTSN